MHFIFPTFLPFPLSFPRHKVAPQIQLKDSGSAVSARRKRTTFAATRHVPWALNTPKNSSRPKRIFTARPHCSRDSVRLSVCLSVCLSFTFRYCVQTNEDTIVRFSAFGRTIRGVSGELKFIRIFTGNHP